ASGDPPTAVLEAEVPIDSCGWLAARCHGDHLMHHQPEQRVFAHTSPVYITVPGQKPRLDADARARLTGHLDRMLDWVRREARCPTEKHRATWENIFTAARSELERRTAP